MPWSVPRIRRDEFLRIDPELVIVVAAGRAAHDGDRFAAIIGAIERDVRHVDDVGVIRIDGDAHEVPATAGDAGISVGKCPGVAAVVGAIKTGLLAGIDQRVHALSIWRDGNTDASPIAIGKSVAGELRPSRAAVGRAINPSAGALYWSVGAPRRPMRSPCAGEENVRVCSGDRQIGDADVRAFVEHVRPGRAAVGGLEDAALVVRTIGVAERADVDNVGIAGIDDDAADLPRVAADRCSSRFCRRRWICRRHRPS